MSEAQQEGHRPIVVQKYGGSSVADPEKLKQVAARVAATHRAGRRVVVVVSAMGKTTDQLIALARTITPSPPRRELDMLMSTGERISMALLAMALDDLGVAAISFTGSQSGILTNDRHSGARIIEVRPVRIEDELERGKVVIVAGFQGMSYRREITTLGRGGSDTTAVALAAALAAEACEIYSDVDGVYSADPRVVPGARRLDEVSWPEMQELAEHGAKVLNAQAVEWARKAGIVIHARATRTPVGEERGAETRVVGDGTRRNPPTASTVERRRATAIAGSERLVRVQVRSTATAAVLLDELNQAEAALRRFAATEWAAEAIFSVEDLPDWGRVRERLAARCVGCVIDEVAAVSAVGLGVGGDAASIGAALRALRRVEIEPLAVEAAPLRVTFTCKPGASEAASRALHAALVELRDDPAAAC